MELASLLEADTGIRYGTGTPPPIVEPGENTLPFVRATDIKENQIQLDGLLHISSKQDKSMDKCRIQAGEMILVRSGVNTGDCAVVPQSLEGSYAAYDLILRFNEKVLPEYVEYFLDTRVGRLQINVRKGRAAQPHINAEEVGSIRIPLPDLDTQHALVAEMEAARATRQSKLAEADKLNDIEDYLMHELGLDNLIKDGRYSFAVKLEKLKNKRLDPPSHRPYYKQSDVNLPIKPLGEIADIDKNTAEKPQDANALIPYVGLPECDKTSVREVVFRPYKEVKGRSVIKQGDILFCRIEPGVFTKKYILANDLLGQEYAYTSTEVYVVKAKEEIVVQEYLYAMFFCPFVYSQIEGKTTGSSGRRRIDPEMFSALSIPLPNKQKQVQIATEIKRRRALARQLREEAESAWQEAKSQFEKKLLG